MKSSCAPSRCEGDRVRPRHRMRRRLAAVSIALIALLVAALFSLPGLQKLARYAPQAMRGVLPAGVRRVAPRDATAARIVADAQRQIGTRYNAAYRVIAYPNGDVPPGEGACTDVVVRALRAAGFDLQKLLHEDMTRRFALYPRQWGLAHPDKNIDHRRVPNQMRFFARFGRVLSTRVEAATLASWQPGDVVCWEMQNGQLHTGVLSDGVNSAGVPLVIHNGWMCVEDDTLTRWKIIGHYRFPKR